jgi:hypothetical protein
MIPKAVVAGLVQGQIVSTGAVNMLLQGGQPVTKDMINRIWSDVVKEYPYQSLQFDPSGRGGAFIGEGGPEDAVIIQPPLVQIRSLVDSDPRGVRGVADKVAAIFKMALHHLGGPPPLNLGVKVVYHVPAPGHTAVDFLHTELVKGDEDLRALAGAMSYEASLKVVLSGADKAYVLLIEPLRSDLSHLFVDIDAQFPGVVDVDKIGERIASVNEFVVKQVGNFLERRAKEWGQ